MAQLQKDILTKISPGQLFLSISGAQSASYRRWATVRPTRTRPISSHSACLFIGTCDTANAGMECNFDDGDCCDDLCGTAFHFTNAPTVGPATEVGSISISVQSAAFGSVYYYGDDDDDDDDDSVGKPDNANCDKNSDRLVVLTRLEIPFSNPWSLSAASTMKTAKALKV